MWVTLDAPAVKLTTFWPTEFVKNKDVSSARPNGNCVLTDSLDGTALSVTIPFRFSNLNSVPW